jgi:DNA-binding NarL/FixJ family response regulator
MTAKIRVAILENHQGIIDGYQYRLGDTPDIEIVATAVCGEALEPMLAQGSVDVLLLDVHVPTSPENLNPYPILHLIPRLLQSYPNLTILVISMHTERKLIQAVMETGASGYILKDDRATIRDLASVIRSVASGGIHLSQYAYQQLEKGYSGNKEQLLTPRQLEALSLCAAFPDISTSGLASELFIANSTARNLLSGAYLKLDVRTRTAAIAKARQMGLLPPDVPQFDIREVGGKND